MGVNTQFPTDQGATQCFAKMLQINQNTVASMQENEKKKINLPLLGSVCSEVKISSVFCKAKHNSNDEHNLLHFHRFTAIYIYILELTLAFGSLQKTTPTPHFFIYI